MAEPPVLAPAGARSALPEATDGPNVTVYGYLAYWADELDTVPWDELSHIAVFAATAETDGSLTSTSRWDDTAEVLAYAEQYDVRVHLCVVNFDDDELEALLSDETAWRALVTELGEWVDATGADGVNIDFEGLPYEVKDEMVSFTAALEAEVGEVVLATPAVDWYGSWDYSGLSEHADLFIMGYGYHWSGGNPGPNDPLFGSDFWGQYGLDWSVTDYLTYDADPSRVILGLPLYGIVWDDTDGNIGGTAYSSGSSVSYSQAQAELSTYGYRYDSDADTPYWTSGVEQGWVVDADSVALRVGYAVDAGIGGVGFWALNYDGQDEDLWEGVRAHTTWDETETPADTEDTDVPSDAYTAVPNEPLIAYVGDTVVLDGSASEGPGELTWRWTQTAGAEVALEDANTATPSFVVQASGVHGFALRVGSGGEMSAEARTWVTVPDEGERWRSGCQTATTGGGWLALLGLLALWRRWPTDR